MIEPTHKIAINTIKKQKQGIVFNSSKSSSEKCAEDISKLIYFDGEKQVKPELKNEPFSLNEKKVFEYLSQQITKDLSQPTKQCIRLAKCIKKGIAFHHSGLTSKQRKLVEDNFRNGNIKIISATTSLAAGLDMPAFRVILRSLKRFTGREYDWIPVLEYLQMSGRAGRPGKEDYGESIAISNNEKEYEDIYNKFLIGKPESIYSKLAVEPTLRMYILSLLSTQIVKNYKDLIDFFSKTFWAFQFGDMDRLKFTIDKILNYLNDWKFIEFEKDEFSSANKSNSFFDNINITKLGIRVSQLYIDPLTANELIENINKINSEKEILPITLLNIISNTIEMRPLLRVKNSEFEKIMTIFESNKENIIMDVPDIYDPEYKEYLNSFKTSLCLEEWINEAGENKILLNYNSTPGDLRVKIEKSMWLLYCISEISKIVNNMKIIKDINKLSMRIKYGVKEELLPLLKLKYIGRVRARVMHNNGIKNVLDIKKTDFNILSKLIGSAIAKNIREQIGIKENNISHTINDF